MKQANPLMRHFRAALFSPSLQLAIFFVAMAAVLVWWHYYISRDDAVAVRRLYMHRSAETGRGVPGYVDFLFPAFVLGLGAGLAGAKRSPRWIAIHVLLLSAGVVALQPLFVRWLPPDQVWWWHNDVRSCVHVFWQTALFTGVFAYLGRLYGQRWWGP